MLQKKNHLQRIALHNEVDARRPVALAVWWSPRRLHSTVFGH